jgi:DNA-binding transcriptional LysR family regulator
MELYQLRMFAAVAELGSLTQAAEQLHVSQPAASAQIKLLEEEFGVTLFERKQSGLALTRDGESLLPKIQELLQTAHQVASDARRISGQVTGPIKFAFVTVLEESLLRLKEMVDRTLARHPRLEMNLRHLHSRGIIAGVTSGEFDAGIVLGDRVVPNLRRFPLQKLHYRIVAPRDWTSLRKASWKDLESSTWVSVPKGGSHHQMLMQLFKRMPSQAATFVQGDSEEMIQHLVRMGIGLGLMREDVALEMDREQKIVLVEKGRPTTCLQFIYRTGREGDPAIRAITEVLSELWPDAERLTQNGTEQLK